MAGARRRAGFGGDGTALPFPLPAGIGDLSCQPAAQLEQDKGSNAARGTAGRWKERTRLRRQEAKNGDVALSMTAPALPLVV